ncbi:MAG: hypothetical protein ACXAES_01960 [Promethearchaeota archaeon]|jgi:hypothetical protein
MTLSKRERVIRALERDDEPDKIPIQYLKELVVLIKNFLNRMNIKKMKLL